MNIINTKPWRVKIFYVVFVFIRKILSQHAKIMPKKLFYVNTRDNFKSTFLCNKIAVNTKLE